MSLALRVYVLSLCKDTAFVSFIIKTELKSFKNSAFFKSAETNFQVLG